MRLIKNIRVLEVHPNHSIASIGYKLIMLKDAERIPFSRVFDRRYSFISKFRLLSRFFRAEVHSYLTLSNGKGICIAKKGVFLENRENNRFEKVYNIVRGSRPLSVCEDRDGVIFFGEYFSNKKRDEVQVIASFDAGQSWSIVYSFHKGAIRHIHSICVDPLTGYLWIATGDDDGECVIAYTKDKFKSLEIVHKGGQIYRTCNFLFMNDRIIYGTDSPLIKNFICSMNRSDYAIKKVQKVQGSVINSCQIGNQCFISTTVESSTINADKNSYLWVSEDGVVWNQMTSYKKDIFNGTLFQFGNIRFPFYQTDKSKSLYIFGSALKGIDGHTVEFRFPLREDEFLSKGY